MSKEGGDWVELWCHTPRLHQSRHIKPNYECLLPIVTTVFIMINGFLYFSSCPCIWDHEQSLPRPPPPFRSPSPRITLKLRFVVILGAKLPWRPWCLSASCILRSSFLWGLCASARSMSWNSYVKGCSQQHRDTETELNTVNLGSTTITNDHNISRFSAWWFVVGRWNWPRFWISNDSGLGQRVDRYIRLRLKK